MTGCIWIPRRFTVEGGKALTDAWSSINDGGAYNLWVYAPNGFLRSFEGDTTSWSASAIQPEILIEYNTASKQLLLQVRNHGSQASTVTVAPNNELLDAGMQTVTIPSNSTIEVELSLETSANWYDFTVSATGFARRFAGRMEIGLDGISDPAMATHL